MMFYLNDAVRRHGTFSPKHTHKDNNYCNGTLDNIPANSNMRKEFLENHLSIKLNSCYFQMWITRKCNSGNLRFIKYATMPGESTTAYDQSVLDELIEIRRKNNLNLSHNKWKQDMLTCASRNTRPGKLLCSRVLISTQTMIDLD